MCSRSLSLDCVGRLGRRSRNGGVGRTDQSLPCNRLPLTRATATPWDRRLAAWLSRRSQSPRPRDPVGRQVALACRSRATGPSPLVATCRLHDSGARNGLTVNPTLSVSLSSDVCLWRLPQLLVQLWSRGRFPAAMRLPRGTSGSRLETPQPTQGRAWVRIGL